MSKTLIVRLSGMSAVAGGVLIAAYDFYSFSISSQASGFDSAVMYGFLLLKIGGLFALLGMPGLYAVQYSEVGSIGFIGFVLAFIGVALFFAWGGVTIAPELVGESTIFMTEGVQSRLSKFLFTSGRRIFSVVGLILFSIASIRAKIFSLWGPVVILIGSFLGGLVAFGIANLIPVGEIAIIGIGVAILGFELAAGPGRQVRSNSNRVQTA